MKRNEGIVKKQNSLYKVRPFSRPIMLNILCTYNSLKVYEKLNDVCTQIRGTITLTTGERVPLTGWEILFIIILREDEGYIKYPSKGEKALGGKGDE